MRDGTEVTTCLWFDGTAEEAVEFYTSLLPDSGITSGMRPDANGSALMVGFTLAGTPFQALNGGPEFKLTEAVSISVTTKSQAETDRLWAALTADGGSEGQCAWPKDRFGLSWQIVPEAVHRLLGSADRAAAARAMKALMGMRKIDVAAPEAAFRGD